MKWQFLEVVIPVCRPEILNYTKCYGKEGTMSEPSLGNRTWKLTFDWIIPGGPKKHGTVDTVNLSGLCSDQQLFLFTLMDRASFRHYNNTKIIKFVWELFILWVISYGLSFSGFARGTINDSFSSSSTCANTYQHSTSYKEISLSMTCLDCKSLLGNTRITEHNTRSIYGRPKLSLIVPRNSGNRANPENDSP